MEDAGRHALLARMLRQPRLLAASAAAVTVAVALPGNASATAPTKPCAAANPYDYAVCQHANGSKGSRDQSPAGGGPSKQRKPAKPTPCHVTKMEQPPKDSSLWEGKDPKKGKFYWRTCNKESDGETQAGMFFAQDPPEVTVDPAEVAQQAIDEMTLLGPEIVSPKADGTYTVGVPLWLRAGSGATRWGPNSASATAGGVTVTATAKVSKVVWRMGDGTSVTCTSRGAVYKRSMGLKESPNCGHTYKVSSASKPKKRITITATSTWSIQWQEEGGGGESGTDVETRTSQVSIPVGEGQVVGQ